MMQSKKMEKKIRFIVTGGTFDKQYDPKEGTLSFADTHLPEILENSALGMEYEVSVMEMIDSLEMVEENRNNILKVCTMFSEEVIIITHGTDTMELTAKYLGKRYLQKVIILTGAMVPYTVRDSDAVFNLGASVAASQLLAAGVYICMNGIIFPWDNVRKNRDAGKFESTH